MLRVSTSVPFICNAVNAAGVNYTNGKVGSRWYYKAVGIETLASFNGHFIFYSYSH